MAGKQHGLGKGLGALLPADEPSGITELPIEVINFSPYQPRSSVNENALEELTQSIKRSGVIQPIVVRRTRIGYEIVAGERRLRAAKLAGFDRIQVVIKEISDHNAAEFALVENIQREDLNPIDIARAMKRLREEFNYTQDTIADGIKKSRPYVANLLRLLDLPSVVQDAILNGQISEAHGRTMLSLKEPSLIFSMMDKVIKEVLSVRETERLVKKFLEELPIKKQKKQDNKTPEMTIAEAVMRSVLGTKVRVLKNRIEIEYYGKEDLERICEVISK